MKKRYTYALLFGLPGLFIAGLLTLVLFGASLGVLWLFVFGDNPWPTGWEIALTIALVMVFLAVWVGLLLAGYHIGKRLEADPAVNRIHILFSLGLTAAFIVFILVQQWRGETLDPNRMTRDAASIALPRVTP